MNQNLTNVYKVVLVLTLVGIGIWSRLVPHPANITALTAVALFGGAMLPGRWSIGIPVGAMIASDLIIGTHSLSLVVWASFALVAVIGGLLKNRVKAPTVILASLAGSTVFYLITNFAVWLEGRMYAMDFNGLVQCYVNALPFFRNMVMGDLLYTGALFGLFAVVMSGVRLLAQRKQDTTVAIHLN